MKRLWIIIFLVLCCDVFAGEVIPPAPPKYFNDYARVVSPATAERLNKTLEEFERESSSQIVVAVYPKMQSDSSIEDYSVRTFRAWKVGQKDKDNGALLLVFVQDRKMYVTVGYGLEGALPDALCKRIIEEQIVPRFKSRDFDGGLSAGVQSLIAAAKGEYRGTGRTVAERRGRSPLLPGGAVLSLLCPLAFMALIVFILVSQRRRGVVFRNRGWMWTGGMGGWGGGGGWSGGGGGGFSGGGGGGFSGGGGSSGGGGAGGSW